MGYEFDIIIKSLRALKEQKNYTPVGEVQRAVDWINDYITKENDAQIKAIQR